MAFKLNNNTKHPFHMLKTSPWPVNVSFAVFGMLFILVMYFHTAHFEFFLSAVLLFILSFCFIFLWFIDIINETTKKKQHTTFVQSGLRYGFALFILSEIMFFFSFFWAFFHSSLSPTIQIGAVWPPIGITTIPYMTVPLLNTLILLFSGISATLAHHGIRYLGLENKIKQTSSTISVSKYTIKEVSSGIAFFLVVSIILGIIFSYMQYNEYIDASFTISDSIYGALFYVMTGFHGLHVLIGTILLFILFIRFSFKHFYFRFYFGAEAAIWYWHFVDVVWIFLFLCIYWWGDVERDLLLYVYQVLPDVVFEYLL
jgi:cytochrome c oxidase subunit 3